MRTTDAGRPQGYRKVALREFGAVSVTGLRSGVCSQLNKSNRILCLDESKRLISETVLVRAGLKMKNRRRGGLKS